MSEMISLENYGSVSHIGSQIGRKGAQLVGNHAFLLDAAAPYLYSVIHESVRRHPQFMEQALEGNLLAVVTKLKDVRTLGQADGQVMQHGDQLLKTIAACEPNYTDYTDLSILTQALLVGSGRIASSIRHRNRRASSKRQW